MKKCKFPIGATVTIDVDGLSWRGVVSGYTKDVSGRHLIMVKTTYDGEELEGPYLPRELRISK